MPGESRFLERFYEAGQLPERHRLRGSEAVENFIEGKVGVETMPGDVIGAFVRR